MKKKIFIICVIFLCLFFCILSYKFFATGNNKNIENIGEINDFILKIQNYESEANVTIISNKNSNTYNVKQHKEGNCQSQEIINDDGTGLIIENNQDRLIIKNTSLSVEKVFENYEEVAKNDIGFDSFVSDLKNSEQIDLTEDENNYIVFVKIKNAQNKYIENKTLYIDKKSNMIKKIEVKDVNNHETIIIEYTKFQIL